VPTLYGIPIPPGATQVEVRPIFGRGQRRLLYRGPVEQDGVFITEDAIADHVAVDEAFWQYVSAQVSAKALQPTANGVWAFKLSVCFQDQHGAPATLDPDAGLTSRATSEAWEFYRGTGRTEDATAVGTLASALSSVIAKQGEASAAQTQASMLLVKALADATKDIAATAIKESMAPLIEAQKLIADNAKRDAARADGLTVDLFKHITQRATQGTGSGLGLVRDLIGIAREAKTFLN